MFTVKLPDFSPNIDGYSYKITNVGVEPVIIEPSQNQSIQYIITTTGNTSDFAYSNYTTWSSGNYLYPEDTIEKEPPKKSIKKKPQKELKRTITLRKKG